VHPSPGVAEASSTRHRESAAPAHFGLDGAGRRPPPGMRQLAYVAPLGRLRLPGQSPPRGVGLQVPTTDTRWSASRAAGPPAWSGEQRSPPAPGSACRSLRLRRTATPELCRTAPQPGAAGTRGTRAPSVSCGRTRGRHAQQPLLDGTHLSLRERQLRLPLERCTAGGPDRPQGGRSQARKGSSRARSGVTPDVTPMSQTV
jgi:hypothetical protein